MKDLKQQLATDVISLMASSALVPQEKAILAILFHKWGSGSITQEQIINNILWKEANDAVTEKDTKAETLTRKVRRYIRNLRVKHKIPVLHNRHGHYLPENQDDMEAFIIRLEMEAKGRAASSIETYKVMKEAVGAGSTYFEQLDFVGTQLIKQV